MTWAAAPGAVAGETGRQVGGRRMAGITVKQFDAPDDTTDFIHGRAAGVVVGDDEQVWRSELEPGWSWDEEIKPYTDGLEACPLYHREFVIAGRIRYLMTDGTETIAEPGQLLFIEPGHRAWVEGNSTCVLLDW